MTEKELREQNADLVAQIEAAAEARATAKAAADERARIRDIETYVELDPADSARVLVHISYVVRATNNPYNLVYPYYINEGLEG